MWRTFNYCPAEVGTYLIHSENTEIVHVLLVNPEECLQRKSNKIYHYSLFPSLTHASPHKIGCMIVIFYWFIKNDILLKLDFKNRSVNLHCPTWFKSNTELITEYAGNIILFKFNWKISHFFSFWMFYVHISIFQEFCCTCLYRIISIEFYVDWSILIKSTSFFLCR